MREEKIFEYKQYIDADIPYSRDLSQVATQRGTTVSTVTASSTGYVTLTISSESTASGIWYGTISGATVGEGQITLSIVYADGSDDTRYFNVEITDPRLTKS